MGADYIPEKDHKAGCWMKWFARRLVEQPKAFRTTPEDAAEVDALVLAFRTALAAAWPRGTRNRVLISTKNNARKAAEQLVRPTAQRIRTDPRIAPELKVQIGLKPKTKRRRQIPTPKSVPVLMISRDLGGSVTLKIVDSVSDRRGKPKGSKGLELYEHTRPYELADGPRPADAASVSDPAPADGVWRYIGLYTRTPINLNPSIGKPGDEVCYIARWVTSRGYTTSFGRSVSISPWFNPLRNLGASPRLDRRAVA